jgi:hypothetical protein
VTFLVMLLPPNELRHFFDVGRGSDVILPQPVQPAAHEVVHDVVRIRDAVKNLPNLGFLLLPPHLLKSKVRRRLRRCSIVGFTGGAFWIRSGARRMALPSRATSASKRLPPDP